MDNAPYVARSSPGMASDYVARDIYGYAKYPANERRRYKVTPSLIGLAQT